MKSKLIMRFHACFNACNPFFRDKIDKLAQCGIVFQKRYVAELGNSLQFTDGEVVDRAAV